MKLNKLKEEVTYPLYNKCLSAIYNKVHNRVQNHTEYQILEFIVNKVWFPSVNIVYHKVKEEFIK